MSPICQYILSQFAAGIPLCKVCREYLGRYCDDNGIERLGYYDVKRWLTMSIHEEEYREFRKEYKIIQKNLMPILIDELRYDAEEIIRYEVDDKKREMYITDPKRLDSFRVRLAALKFLESHLRAPKNPNFATRTRKIATKPTPVSPAQNPSNLNPEGKIVNCKSQIVNGLSSFPGMGISLPKITLQSAEEILGSPILNHFDNDDDCRGVWHTPTSNENPQHLSIDLREKSGILASDEIVNCTSEIVNQNALCQNSLQPPTQDTLDEISKSAMINPKSEIYYLPLPNFYSGKNPNPG
jgi:hypothetical protein